MFRVELLTTEVNDPFLPLPTHQVSVSIWKLLVAVFYQVVCNQTLQACERVNGHWK